MGIQRVLVAGVVMVFGSGLLAAQHTETTEKPCVPCAHWEAYRHVNAARFEQAYINSLRHDVDGVVEIAIREVALIKIAQPGFNSPGITTELHRLSGEGRTLPIRVKAALAESVLDNALLIEENGGFATDEDLFTAIVQAMHRQPYGEGAVMARVAQP